MSWDVAVRELISKAVHDSTSTEVVWAHGVLPNIFDEASAVANSCSRVYFVGSQLRNNVTHLFRRTELAAVFGGRSVHKKASSSDRSILRKHLKFTTSKKHSARVELGWRLCRWCVHPDVCLIFLRWYLYGLVIFRPRYLLGSTNVFLLLLFVAPHFWFLDIFSIPERRKPRSFSLKASTNFEHFFSGLALAGAVPRSGQGRYSLLFSLTRAFLVIFPAWHAGKTFLCQS